MSPPLSPVTANDATSFSGASWTARYARARATLDRAQKPGDGVPAYMRWINRRGARVVAAAGHAWGWTPNFVTALSACWSALGLALLLVLPATLSTGIVVAALLAAGFLFDSADGQLARLSRSSSPAGEWLDHVVDAFRAPAIHLGAAVAVAVHRPEYLWLAVVALVYAVVTSGQFMSQILAEQFVRRAGRRPRRGGMRSSLLLLPTDPGILCWSFALWGLPAVHALCYTLLALAAVLHTAVSLRRRFRDVSAVPDPAAASGLERGTPEMTPVVSHA